MCIRDRSWYWYALGGVLIVLLAFAIAWSMLQRGEAGERQRELDSLRHQVRELDDELLKLRSTAGTESALQKFGKAHKQKVCAGNSPQQIPEKLK